MQCLQVSAPSLEQRINTQLAPGLARLDLAPLVAEDGAPRHHRQTFQLREVVDDALREAVAAAGSRLSLTMGSTASAVGGRGDGDPDRIVGYAFAECQIFSVRRKFDGKG
jgi:hypothetical protein